MAGSDGGGPTIIGLTVQVEEDPGAALAALAAVSGKAAAGEDYAPPPDGGVHGSAATGVAMAVRDAEEAYEEEEKAAAARRAEARAAAAAAAQAAAEAEIAAKAAEAEAEAAAAEAMQAAAAEAKKAEAEAAATAKREAKEAAKREAKEAAAAKREAEAAEAKKAKAEAAEAKKAKADLTAPPADAHDEKPRKRKGAAAAKSPVLARAEKLRARARAAGSAEKWEEAAKLYGQACTLLGRAPGEGEPPEAASEEGRLLQQCQLNLALCCVKREIWDQARDVCTEVLKRDARCGTAYYRRAQALLAEDSPDAAVWDLQQAARLSPKSKPVGKLLKKAQAAQAKATASRLAVGGRRGAAGGEMPDFSKMMASMGGGAGGSPDLASLMGGLGGGAGGAAGANPLAGLMGALGGGGKEGADGADAIADLLRSPLLAGKVPGKQGKMLGLVGTALTARKHAKRVWRAVKPWLPLIFWFAVLIPALQALGIELPKFHEIPALVSGLVASFTGGALPGSERPPITLADAGPVGAVPVVGSGLA